MPEELRAQRENRSAAAQWLYAIVRFPPKSAHSASWARLADAPSAESLQPARSSRISDARRSWAEIEIHSIAHAVSVTGSPLIKRKASPVE